MVVAGKINVAPTPIMEPNLLVCIMVTNVITYMTLPIISILRFNQCYTVVILKN